MREPQPALLRARISAGYPDRPEVLRGFELDIAPGEIVGLVGESGAGKSTVALVLLRLLEFKGGAARGSILLNGRDLMSLSGREMRRVRGQEIALVMQSPMTSLNPAMRIRPQFLDAWRAHQKDGGPNGDLDWNALLAMVHLPTGDSFVDRYPRQLSLGQAQRVLIAMSVLHRPALLVADEPTSALDAVTQSGILKLFSQLRRDLGMAILYISHDLLSVASFCDRIAVLHDGRVVETAPPSELFLHPTHPYTTTLISAMPTLRFDLREEVAYV